MTKAEEILWEELRRKKFNVRFRRQHPLGLYVVDFYCHKLKLVIELDGDIHKNPEIADYDRAREKVILAMGLQIIRFTNEDVMMRKDTVLEKIQALVEPFDK